MNAAQTTALTSACDMLYMHGSDLTWGESKQDFFLVELVKRRLMRRFVL